MGKTAKIVTNADGFGDLVARAAVWFGKVTLFFILPLGLLWWATAFLNLLQLRWITAGAVYLWFRIFMLGVEYGKTEAKGFLGGIDAAISKLSAAVDLRDNSRARAAAQRQALNARSVPQAAQFNVYLPDPQALAGTVPITHRQIAGSDVVDL